MAGRMLVLLVGVAMLMSCGSPTALTEEFQYPVVRVALLDARIAGVGASRRLEVSARLDNTGGVEIEASDISLYFRDPSLGWMDVSGPRGAPLGTSELPGFSRVGAGQMITLSRPFNPTPVGATYQWPRGSLTGTYRVGFGLRIGNYILSPLLVSSDPFEVVDSSPP